MASPFDNLHVSHVDIGSGKCKTWFQRIQDVEESTCLRYAPKGSRKELGVIQSGKRKSADLEEVQSRKATAKDFKRVKLWRRSILPARKKEYTKWKSATSSATTADFLRDWPPVRMPRPSSQTQAMPPPLPLQTGPRLFENLASDVDLDRKWSQPQQGHYLRRSDENINGDILYTPFPEFIPPWQPASRRQVDHESYIPGHEPRYTFADRSTLPKTIIPDRFSLELSNSDYLAEFKSPDKEMYEEGDDELPLQFRRLDAHSQTGSVDYNRRLAAYLTNHVAMRSAMDQMINNSVTKL